MLVRIGVVVGAGKGGFAVMKKEIHKKRKKIRGPHQLEDNYWNNRDTLEFYA